MTPAMVRSELVASVAADNPHLTPAQVSLAVDAITGAITDALAKGGRVELRGFGSFQLSNHRLKAGRNPKTGQPLDVPAQQVPRFKAGRIFLRRLNPSAEQI